jgi:hypothetical protein
MNIAKQPERYNGSAQNSVGEYYASLAKEIYTAAKKEGWNAEKTKEMLNNPRDFEKYLIRVSYHFFYNFELETSILSEWFCLDKPRAKHLTKERPLHRKTSKRHAKALGEVGEIAGRKIVKVVVGGGAGLDEGRLDNCSKILGRKDNQKPTVVLGRPNRLRA